MMIPIRCFTCGKPVSDAYEEFVERTKKGEEPGKVMDALGIERFCCRRMFVSHVADLMDEVTSYPRF